MGGIVQSSSKSDIEAVKNNNLFERFVVDEASKASHKEHGEVSFDEYNSEELVSLDEDEPSDEEAHVGRGLTTRINTFVPGHTYGRLQKTKYATSFWLAESFDEELRDHPHMSVGAFMKLVYKAKRKATRRIHTG
ncbi:hypothetical protein ACFX1R_034109 [Malus domestica]